MYIVEKKRSYVPITEKKNQSHSIKPGVFQ